MPDVLNRVCKVFGSQIAVAKALGVGKSAVSNWRRNGIPAAQKWRLLEVARERQLALSLDDLGFCEIETLDPAQQLQTAPHQRIIQRLGGMASMARAGGWPVSTVQRWWESGFIPSRRHGEVFRAAASVGIDLRPDDFFDLASIESPASADTVARAERARGNGNRIKHLRRERGLTQEELADRLGVQHTAVVRWERRTRVEWIDRAIRVAEALGVHPGELFNQPMPPRLTAEESRLIEVFRQLTPDHQTAVIAMAESLRAIRQQRPG